MKSLVLFSVVIASVVGLYLSSGWYTNYRYGVDESITQAKIERIYGSLLDRVESIYQLESDQDIREAVAEIEAEVPKDIGILRLAQRDKGISHVSYGALYFYYSQEHFTQSFFYTDAQIRRAPGLMRGYVKNNKGRRIDALQHRRVIEIDGDEFDIELVLDYRKVLELSNAL